MLLGYLKCVFLTCTFFGLRTNNLSLCKRRHLKYSGVFNLFLYQLKLHFEKYDILLCLIIWQHEEVDKQVSYKIPLKIKCLFLISNPPISHKNSSNWANWPNLSNKISLLFLCLWDNLFICLQGHPIGPNISIWLLLFRFCLKEYNIVQKVAKWFKIVRSGSKQFKILQHGSKWPDLIWPGELWSLMHPSPGPHGSQPALPGDIWLW